MEDGISMDYILFRNLWKLSPFKHDLYGLYMDYLWNITIYIRNIYGISIEYLWIIPFFALSLSLYGISPFIYMKLYQHV